MPKKFLPSDIQTPADFIPTDNFVEYKNKLIWKDGVPYLAETPVRISSSPKQILEDILGKSLDLPYSGKNPSLQGLTLGEAMIVSLVQSAAEGNHDAIEQVLNRLMGRPKQSIESVQLSGDLNSFLDRVAADSKIETVEVVAEAKPSANEDIEDL